MKTNIRNIEILLKDNFLSTSYLYKKAFAKNKLEIIKKKKTRLFDFSRALVEYVYRSGMTRPQVVIVNAKAELVLGLRRLKIVQASAYLYDPPVTKSNLAVMQPGTVAHDKLNVPLRQALSYLV